MPVYLSGSSEATTGRNSVGKKCVPSLRMRSDVPGNKCSQLNHGKLVSSVEGDNFNNKQQQVVNYVVV